MTLKSWFGQSTTGTGVAVLLATTGSLAAGSLSWDHAMPLLVAAVVGLVWPENSALQAAVGNTAASMETVVTAYRAGLSETQTPKSGTSTGSIADPSHNDTFKK